MPEKVVFREDLGVVHIESFGELTLEDMKGSLDSVVRIAREKEVASVLVDGRRLLKMPVSPKMTFRKFLPPDPVAMRLRPLMARSVTSKPWPKALIFSFPMPAP